MVGMMRDVTSSRTVAHHPLLVGKELVECVVVERRVCHRARYTTYSTDRAAFGVRADRAVRLDGDG